MPTSFSTSPGSVRCRLSVRLVAGAALLAFASSMALAVIPAAERTALTNLYASTDGPTWANRTGWNGPIGTECSWYGITCDAQQSHVVGIDFPGNTLIGTLPPLSALPQLQSLTATNGSHASPGASSGMNSLWGAIPPLKDLSHLQTVGFSGQNFSGAIPELAGLSELKTLDLSNNRLSGPLPVLTGLHALQYLDVLNNQLSGSLPAFDDLTQLTYLRLASNFFSGNIPSISAMTQLVNFYADGNQLSGNVPSISGLSKLQTFFLTSNQLSGTLSAVISDLPSLQQYFVDINLLTGSVPALANVPSLRQFYVAVNQLTGQPPAPPTITGFKEGLCPNLLTPAADPPTTLDAALNQATGVTPWSTACTQTPVQSLVRGIAYIDPATADGATVTVRSIVYGRNPTGTVTIYTVPFQTGSPQVTVCENVPVINAFATCRFQASAENWTAQIGVNYSGDANNQPATFFVSSRVSTYQLNLNSNLSSVQTGQSVDLLASVVASTGTPAQPGIDPADTLSFYDGTAVLCAHVPISILAPKQTPGTQLQTIPQITARCSTKFANSGAHVLTVQNDNTLELGKPSAPLTQTVTSPAAFDGDQFALTGTWYNAYTSGQGLVLEVYPTRGGPGTAQLFAGWFTFDAVGNARWRTLQGNLASPHTATYDLTIYRSSGGNFNAPPKTTAIVDGTATLTFHDCTHATLNYQFNDGRTGSISQTRLTDVQGCTSSVPAGPIGSFLTHYDDVAHSGAWYDPQTSGQGIVVDVVPTQSTLFAAWYTYAPQAEAQTDNATQRWFTMQSAYVPGNLTINQVPIYSVLGGAFDTATRTVGLQIGTADIVFSSCDTMSINYHFTQGEFAGLSGSVNEQKIASNPSCH